jgi:acetyl-CoA acetyltransferase
MTSRSVVFAEPVRTAIGAFGGTLKDVSAPDLGAVAIRAAVERAGLTPEEVETVAMGNVIQAGAKMNPARQAAVQAGLPVTVPAMTVNRVCGSGAQAIVSAAQEILLGNANAAVAGGMESMDQAPYFVGRGRWGYRLGDGQLYDSVLRDGSTTLSPVSTQAGIPRTSSRNIRSRAKPRTNGLCAHNSASHARKARVISSRKSRRSKFPARRGRRHSTRTKPIVPTPRSRRLRD